MVQDFFHQQWFDCFHESLDLISTMQSKLQLHYFTKTWIDFPFISACNFLEISFLSQNAKDLTVSANGLVLRVLLESQSTGPQTTNLPLAYIRECLLLGKNTNILLANGGFFMVKDRICQKNHQLKHIQDYNSYK